jgi:hypothetical protein
MVALVLLSLVVVGYLQLLHGSHRVVARSGEWSRAVGYAAYGMEQAKLELPEIRDHPVELLPQGFRRQIVARPWQTGLALLTVTVFLPDGSRFDLQRLAPVATTQRRDPSSGLQPRGEM